MKRRYAVFAVIFAVSILIGIQTVEVVDADPVPLGGYPKLSTAPQVLVLSSGNKTYNTADVPLQFNVNESESQYSYCLDGQPATIVKGNSTLTNLSNGNHNLTVYAVDAARNVGTSETVSFEVDVPFPTIQVTVAVAILSAVVILLPILLFKRRKSKTA